MRYQDRIYIQTPISCVRNKDHINIAMSSDICVFNQPMYNVTGANKIMTGVTVTDDEIHIIDTGTTIDLTFNFTGNVNTFIDTDATFKYKVYKYNTSLSVFSSVPTYESDNIPYSVISPTSAFTDSISTSVLNLDGDYLVKGSYDFTICTEMLNNLNETINTAIPVIGSEYGIYDPEFDFYFAGIKKAIKPLFALSPTDTRKLGALTVESYEMSGETEVTTSSLWSGRPIVSLNGLTFAEEEDYTTIDNTIYFNEATAIDDLVTVAYVNNGNPNGLLSENIVVDGIIVSGGTDGEGSEVIYYNTGTTKYEIYTLADPIEFNDLIVTLNGITLANGLDYYQSTVNPRRIILNGAIYSSGDLGDGNVGNLADIITITYNSYGTYAGTILVDIFDVNWTVNPSPKNTSGKFITLVTSGSTFSSDIIFSAETQYIANETTYSTTIDLSGYSGTTGTYKVTNQKDYEIISGDVLSTFTDSEEIPFEINI